jgi:hypothetical protein
LASGVLKAIHLGVMNHAALLHTLVVAAPDDSSVEHEHRADGDAAGGKTLSGFFDGGLEELIHGPDSTSIAADGQASPCIFGLQPRNCCHASGAAVSVTKGSEKVPVDQPKTTLSASGAASL